MEHAQGLAADRLEDGSLSSHRLRICPCFVLQSQATVANTRGMVARVLGWISSPRGRCSPGPNAVGDRHESEAWFRDLLARSWIADRFAQRVWTPLMARFDARWQRPEAMLAAPLDSCPAEGQREWRLMALAACCLALLFYVGMRAVAMLAQLPAQAWGEIAAGLGATLVRVVIALLAAAAWTIPLGVAIGTRPRLAAVLQPVTQVAASIPATALLPVVLVAFVHLPGGLDRGGRGVECQHRRRACGVPRRDAQHGGRRRPMASCGTGACSSRRQLDRSRPRSKQAWGHRPAHDSLSGGFVSHCSAVAVGVIVG